MLQRESVMICCVLLCIKSGKELHSMTQLIALVKLDSYIAIL